MGLRGVRIGLAVLAASLAAANLWHTARRSTIPLGLGDTISEIEVREEKHPGKDDVFLLRLQSGSVLQVDDRVARNVKAKDVISKAPWERVLIVNHNREVNLEWSRDHRGMRWAMTITLGVIIWTLSVAPRWVRQTDARKPRSAAKDDSEPPDSSAPVR